MAKPHHSVFQLQTQAKLFAYFVDTIKTPKGVLIVSTTGVEPARPYGHIPLKDARLPIPPRGHLFRLRNFKDFLRFCKFSIIQLDVTYEIFR